jgi:hypothetical protein
MGDNAAADRAPDLPLGIELRTPISGTKEWDWWQARTAFVPGEKPILITTMSETGKQVSHDFHDIYQSVSRDAGRTWSEPALIHSLKRVKQGDGYEVAPGDLWPAWHAKSGKVLATGKTFNFAEGKRENRLREKVSYAVMDPKKLSWGPMRFLKMPKKDHAGHPIIAANAGNTQRVDLPNGDILLPVRYERDPEKHNYTSVVARCGFDGKKLVYKEHGSELSVPKGRGLYEPSLAVFEGKYYLTLRADHSAFVTRGNDGITFEPVREWQFDDGKPLGSYNTQQHWVTAGGGLFLVYTRKGANNDHIFRHRSPLFIAQVDPATLRVIRATERVLLPENHATLGNSGICWLNENESLVTCGEGLMRLGQRKGEHNKVLFVKVNAAKKTSFVHPGVLHNRAELDFVRKKVRAAEEPWISAWQALAAHRYASLDWKPRAHPHVTRGPRARPRLGAGEMMEDCTAAYTHALHWSISGERAHAAKAIEILDNYADTLQSVTKHDARLLVGMSGVHFANAAELIAHSEAGWPAERRERFGRMLRELLYPVIENFFPTANGNWDTSMIQTMMAMGVFLDDQAMFQRGVDYYRQGKGNGCLTNYLKPSGQCQESGRDQHHTQMGLGYLGVAAEIAWKQGIGLYSVAGNRLAAGYEYNSKYNLGHEVPFERFVSVGEKYDHTKISEVGRGCQCPVHEIVYRHYHGRQALPMEFTGQMLKKTRPENPVSTHTPWASLMFAEVP